MMTIDPTNERSAFLQLYTVDQRHQADLVELLTAHLSSVWVNHPYFVAAGVHRSLDATRVFGYSQWQPQFDPRQLPLPAAFSEFSWPELRALQVFASRSRTAPISVQQDQRITHLAEFKLMPHNQPEMIRRATTAVDEAMHEAGLLSATFHRSLDGERVYNYGQWENQAAFDAFVKKGVFNPDHPYWQGIARNEYHLYEVVAVVNKVPS